MTHPPPPDLLAALRREESRVVPEWFYAVHLLLVDAYGPTDGDAAATLILIGCMAEWLGGHGVAVARSELTGDWLDMDLNTGEVISIDATDCLSAHFAATMRRLSDMPTKEGC